MNAPEVNDDWIVWAEKVLRAVERMAKGKTDDDVGDLLLLCDKIVERILTTPARGAGLAVKLRLLADFDTSLTPNPDTGKMAPKIWRSLLQDAEALS